MLATVKFSLASIDTFSRGHFESNLDANWLIIYLSIDI